MTRAGLLTALVVAVSASLVAAAQAPGAGQAAPPAAALEQGTKDFARNAALGAALSKRPGTPAELRELQELADGGLRAARELAGKSPESAEASYLLGSWVIYGYRVVRTRQVTVDATAGATSEVTERVVQGLSDEPQEGLGALKRAQELDPKRGEYVVDYGTALLDRGRDAEAMSFLKATWSGNASLTAQEKMQTGLLLSDVSAHRGDLAEAREWVYSALEAVPENRAIVAYLRSLDVTLPPLAAEVAAAEAAAGAETARAAARGLLPQCPFVLEAGSGIRLSADSTEESMTLYQLDYRADTVARIEAGRWMIKGVGDEPLHISLTLPDQEKGLVSAGTEEVSGSALRGPGSGVPGHDWIWQDQSFEIYLGGVLVDQFDDTAGYEAATREQQ